jgi:hypothetical protein
LLSISWSAITHFAILGLFILCSYSKTVI